MLGDTNFGPRTPFGGAMFGPCAQRHRKSHSTQAGEKCCRATERSKEKRQRNPEEKEEGILDGSLGNPVAFSNVEGEFESGIGEGLGWTVLIWCLPHGCRQMPAGAAVI